MNRKAFIQQASITMMLHPYSSEKAPAERVDAAINLAEALWERLKDRGYGPTTQTSERCSKNWYSEIQGQEEFDKCRRKYGDEGGRNDAAKAWIGLDEEEKVKVFPAIPKYIESLKYSGKSKAHFATWINQKRFLNYEETEKKQSKPAYNELAQEIAGFERQLELVKKSGNQAMIDTLESHINKLKSKQS